MAGKRAALKEQSHERILDVAVRQMHRHGMAGAPIADIMREAGLTHGAFYAHFADKDDLRNTAFRRAVRDPLARWFGTVERDPWPDRMASLARRYLSRGHRDDTDNICPLAAFAHEMPRSSVASRETYEAELRHALDGIVGEDADLDPGDGRHDAAIVLLALCVGGLALSKSVEDVSFSDRILRSCRTAAAQLARYHSEPTPRSERYRVKAVTRPMQRSTAPEAE